MSDETPQAPPQLFPAFEAWAEKNLRGKVSGILSAKLPRILGQGRTRAEGLDLPPAPIERRQTLAGLDLPSAFRVPPEVEVEIREARRQVELELEAMKRPDAIKRFAVGVIKQLQASLGTRDRRPERWSILRRAFCSDAR